MLSDIMMNTWSLIGSVVTCPAVVSSVESSNARARPFSFRMQSTQNFQATWLFFPVAMNPSSFSIE